MKKNEPKQIRNIAIVGHGKSGKTSLGEALLFSGKATDRLCKVDNAESVLDFEPEEKDRRMTITSGLHHVTWKKHVINIVDTPGDANFVYETFNSLQIVDAAVLVVDAASGVQLVTEKAWQRIREFKLPAVIFVNKLDREHTDFFTAVGNIKDALKINIVPVQVPIGGQSAFKGYVDLIKMKGYQYATDDTGTVTECDIPADMQDVVAEYRQKLVEDVAESNENLMEKYLDGQDISDEELSGAIKEGVVSGALTCVMCGSAIKNFGARQLMDFVVQFFPSPLERPVVNAVNIQSGEPVQVPLTEDGPLFAYVFKTIADPYAGKLTLFRVFAGSLAGDGTVYNVKKKVKEKIGSILQVEGKAQKPIDVAVTGDIVALAKLRETTTGDTFGPENSDVVFKGIDPPKPVASYAVIPKSRGDEDKMAGAFARLIEEDPTLQLKRDEQTNEFILSGVGQSHLDVTVAKLKRKFGVEIEMQLPKIPYRETIKGRTKVQGKHKKQTGGRGQYADTWIEIEPLPRGGGFEFVDKIVGGAIPRNYIPAVEKGIVNQMKKGILAGYPIVDVRVTLYDGGYHEVDSSDMAFQIAGSKGFKKGFMECNPVLLEPIMNVEIIVPEEMTGDIMGDINGRRGRVLGMEQTIGGQLIKAHVPLAEMQRYSAELTALTSGRGMFTMEFDHYEEVPAHLAQKVIAASKVGAEEEEEE
ncbi:MAG: elongation factor G [Desulfobacterota bacterium]|nr:elongation factor G [Thermodesulfobacteriota bacterium]